MKALKLEARSIRNLAKKLFSGFSAQYLNEQIVVPISQCRHYCAFKYGSVSLNPYENYMTGLHEGQPLHALREQFEDFLRYFRPRNFGQVFDIELSPRIPLWCYPWQHGMKFNPNQGWLENLDEVPDILTHFCERGIKRSRIEEEYSWLKRAYNTMRVDGYQPETNSYITALALKKATDVVYLLTDGNHRVGAQAALGRKEVRIKVLQTLIWDGSNHRKWPQVRLGLYSEEDAFRVFNVYFEGVQSFRRASSPALILDA